MKKLLALITALILLFSLSSCQGTYAGFSSGTLVVNGVTYKYKATSLYTKRIGNEISIGWNHLEGDYVTESFGTRGASSIEYTVSGDLENLDIRIISKERTYYLSGANGRIDLTETNSRNIQFIFSSQSCDKTKITINLTK